MALPPPPDAALSSVRIQQDLQGLVSGHPPSADLPPGQPAARKQAAPLPPAQVGDTAAPPPRDSGLSNAEQDLQGLLSVQPPSGDLPAPGTLVAVISDNPTVNGKEGTVLRHEAGSCIVDIGTGRELSCPAAALRVIESTA